MTIRLPKRLEQPLFALPLSCLMFLLVPGVATRNAVGPIDDSGAKWLAAWLSSWVVAFPAVMAVAPLVRKIVERCVQPRV